MAHYILVHGAWHSGWCWHNVASILLAHGHSVLVPDLPSHGSNDFPPRETTLQIYARSIEKIIRAQPKPPIVVGHSMGGIVISEAIEKMSDHVKAAVFVTAFLPKNGESLSTYALQDEKSLIPQSIAVDENGVSTIIPATAQETLYGNTSEADAAAAIDHLGPQNTAFLDQPLSLSEQNFGTVAKYYVRCTKDRAISIEIQDLMCRNWALNDIKTLETDHSPFLSKPAELAELLRNFDQ